MKAKNWLATVALATLAACGSSPYLGTWSVSGGTDSATCDGISFSANPSGNITFANGTNGNIESTDSSTGCDLSWTESGNVLTIVAGQTCAETANNVTYNVALSTGSVTLNSTDNNTLTMSLSGAGSADGATCTFSDTINANKVSN